ncbi:MAG: fasciclin domain-containing protein [Phycisphaerales bacterium]|nr:fasciclin domain-containing protein [Phycisphaerales bacterium]
MLTSLVLSSVAVLGGQDTCSSQVKVSTQPMMTTVASAEDIVVVADNAGQFKTLLAAAKAAGLVEVLKGNGPLTVFAPTDDAFSKLPPGTVEMLLKPENKAALASVLTYHVVPGKMMAADVLKQKNLNTVNGQRADISMKNGRPMIDKAAIVATDIKASNGVIHVIDAVILPEQNDIIGVATKAGTFNTLAAALTEAELVETLQGKGPFTVLAPTDEAFAKLPKGTVENLLKPENRETLKTILLYHVVPGRVFSDQVVTLSEAPTAAGINAPIKKTKDGLTIGGARVVATDIESSNGVIHVIDTVMIPE